MLSLTQFFHINLFKILKYNVNSDNGIMRAKKIFGICTMALRKEKNDLFVELSTQVKHRVIIT